MTKKFLLTLFFMVFFALSSFNLLHAQKDTSIQVKQFSLETGNLFALKQKIVNDPSLSWLATFFDNIDQLKNSKYTVTGHENFPPKYRRQLSKQVDKAAAIIIQLFDKPEKEYSLIPKLEKITEQIEDIVSTVEDKYNMNLSGQKLTIKFPDIKLGTAKQTQ
ncbi:hypothetical protein A3860_33280 [Niastella vici]|uniref:Uncharacterized protein n=1 Tax=Niastella vici TaxID=1703345 RepID=A0A1V9FQL0_9BACT|nr:hypothetical protein [Niastella vici]OQP60536.1 hypothetical protein A3860_33280 [Niastella vici]